MRTRPKTQPAVRAGLFSLALLAACANDPQVIEGRIAVDHFQAPVVGVRAVQGQDAVAWAPVGADGRFSLEVPEGAGYRLEVVTERGTHGFAVRGRDYASPNTFDVCNPEDPFDVGDVEPWDMSGPNGCVSPDGVRCDPADPACGCEPPPPPCDPTTDPDCGLPPCGPDDPDCVPPPPCDPTTDPNCLPCDPMFDPYCACKLDPASCLPPPCDPTTDPSGGCEPPPPPPCDPTIDPTCEPPCDLADPACQCAFDPMSPDCRPPPCDPTTDPYCMPPCSPDDPSCAPGGCDPSDPFCQCDSAGNCKPCGPDDPNCLPGGGGCMDNTDPSCWPQPEPPTCENQDGTMTSDADDACWDDCSVPDDALPDFGCGERG